MVEKLSLAQLKKLGEIATAGIARRGSDFFGWRNAPEVQNGVLTHTEGWGESATTRPISVEEALSIDKAKLDGAYGERFALSVGLALGLAQAGAEVHLIQKVSDGSPFDAKGWLILAINGHPLFHISPDDLSVEECGAAGLVSLVADGSSEAEQFGWKGTNKVGELSMLIELMSK